MNAAGFLDRRGHWLAFPAGVALAAAFAPIGIAPLAVLCPAFLFLAWQGATPRAAAWRGFLFTSGTFLAGTYWLYNSIHLVGQAPLWVALFLMLGLVAIMGSYTAVLGYLAARWGPRTGLVRWLVLLPAGWVLVEWFRGWFLSGFPWLALGYSQLSTPLRGFAPVAGVYGTSLVTALLAGALVTLILGRRSARLAALGTVLVIVVAGALLTRVVWTQPRGTQVSVALVQGAVPQSMKWEAGQRERTLDLYARLTAPHLGADIVVWPEAALPALERDIRGFLDGLHAAARARGTDLILGQLRRDPDTGAYYNGMLALAATEQWYHKRRLVPFGEFFPVPAQVREWLRLMNLPYSDFEAGADDQPPLAAAGETLAPTICYEDAYASEQLALARAATLLVNVTNDAWFGDSTAPHQHLDISRMRSLETGRPMLRATNDGVTALIGHDGTLLGTLPQFEAGVLTGTVQPRVGSTPYLRFGNWPVLAIAFLAFALGCAWPRLRGRAGERR
ncbi:MAG: apolipoprotein N-acyltransferase [Steroidobacteraceae bacterium]|nr:apolipoprotein N-acyltransferase [Steroidobacteraceae bacterium]